MSKNEIKQILLRLKNKSKKTTYFIIDIPKYHRVLEFILLPFFSIKRFLFSAGLIFNKEYKKIKIYHHQLKDFNFLRKHYEINKISNLYDVKFLRYTSVNRVLSEQYDKCLSANDPYVFRPFDI